MSLSKSSKSILSELRIEDVLAGVFLAADLGLSLWTGLSSGNWSFNENLRMLSWFLLPLLLVVLKESAWIFFHPDSGPASSIAHRVLRIARDWFPFLLILLLYASFSSQLWSILQPHDRDAWLQAIDQRFFGFQASVALQPLIRPWLTDWLSLCYTGHLLYAPILGYALYARGQLRAYRQFMIAMVAIFLLGFAGYIAIPAVGPYVAMANRFTVSLRGGLYRPMEFVMLGLKAPRDAFPSLHVGLSLLVLIFAFVYVRRLGWALLPFILSNCFATIYLRAHYLIDVVAGAALAYPCYRLGRWLLERETRWKSKIAGTARPGTEHSGP
jgi:membrane-associated phospholipid phosphatase